MDDAYYHIALTPAQQSLISSVTPFRFRPISSPSSSPSTADPVLIEPFLPLPLPSSPRLPSTLSLILTPPRPSDLPAQLSCLNDPRVGLSLVGPPYPYTEEHGREFGRTKAGGAEEYFGRVGGLAQALLDGGEGRVEEFVKSVKEGKELPREWLPNGCPVNAIRREDTDEWVGDLGTMRWLYEDVEDAQERERLAKENLAREVGDPELAWSFGFFLHPTYHSLGLMSPCLSTLLKTVFMSFLRCHQIHGAAFADNHASLRTQEKNGLVKYGRWVRDVAEARGGGRKEVVVLKWEKGDQE
ncbi:hypothetical protein JCM8547_009326 [Rhodosporidiobolus lusitaniae]